MYQITVKGEARTDYPHLVELHGIMCEDDFTDYFDSDFTFVNNVKNGIMSFHYESGKLMTWTTYESDRELTTKELNILKDYTVGQWSDGIGEGFEQSPCFESRYAECGEYGEYEYEYEYESKSDVYISPWHEDQIATIEQVLIS